MAMLEVSLLGKFSIRCEGKGVVALRVNKVQELLCYLLVNRREPHHREALATLLWEDVASTQSKQYLRKTLWQLQSALDKFTPVHDLLLVDDDWIQLNTHANFRLDLADFESTYAASQSLNGSDLSPALVDAIERSVELYHGDLLQGWYQEWCLIERERFLNMYLTMLDKLLDYCIVRGETARGVQYGMQILRTDLARERTYRQLMYLHALAGDRAGALRCYERCRAVLSEELGVEPARSTVQLYEQVCRDQVPVPSAASGLLEPVPMHLSRRLHQVSDSLNAMRATLSEMQNSIDRQLMRINEMLRTSSDHTET